MGHETLAAHVLRISAEGEAWVITHYGNVDAAQVLRRAVVTHHTQEVRVCLLLYALQRLGKEASLVGREKEGVFRLHGKKAFL